MLAALTTVQRSVNMVCCDFQKRLQKYNNFLTYANFSVKNKKSLIGGSFFALFKKIGRFICAYGKKVVPLQADLGITL